MTNYHRAVSDDAMDTLEMLMDSAGLARVIDAIAEICYQKSEHISETWQDRQLANVWAKAAAYLVKVSRTKTIDV